MDDGGYGALLDLLAGRVATGPRPFLLGIGGGVAAGKTTLAEQVRDRLAPRTVAVVGLDGFLFPNARLADLGLLARKGFPATYDVDTLRQVLAAVRRRDGGVRVPRYSHAVYDVVPGDGDPLPPADIVILEGVHALGFGLDLDLGVYLDAAEADIESWYLARFVELCAQGREDPSSFYAQFAALDDAGALALGEQVWSGVNAVNLREHIAPTRANADVVVTKGRDQRVERVEVRSAAPR